MPTDIPHPRQRHPNVTSALKAVTQADETLRAIDLRTVKGYERALHKDARTSLAEVKRILRTL